MYTYSKYFYIYVYLFQKESADEKKISFGSLNCKIAFCLHSLLLIP